MRSKGFNRILEVWMNVTQFPSLFGTSDVFGVEVKKARKTLRQRM